MKTLFSIVIPTLNEQVCIPKILNDLKNQKEKNFETIIVDASSTDETKNKIHDFSPFLLIKLYEVDKKNVAFSRNFGAGKAEGEYLVFLDADSRISSSFTSKLKKIIIKKKGLFFLPYIIPDERDSQSKFIFGLVNFLIDFSQNLNKPFSSGGNMIIEKNFFKKLNGFDEKLFMAEDHNMVQRAHQWGVKAKFLHEVTVKFSLRRMRREGQLSIFYKYIVATIHVILKGDIKEKIFDYKMGGQESYPIKKRFSFINGGFNDPLRQVGAFFKRYLS